MKQLKLIPSVTLKEIFGPNHVLNPRPSFSDYGWLTNNPRALDCLTGTPLAIVGDLPMICSNAVSTQETKELFRLANVNIPSCLYGYDSAEQYRGIINKLVQGGEKLIINYVHPQAEIPPSAYWIDPQLVAFLNNKANLNQLVSPNHLPKRITIHPSELSTYKYSKPVIVKVGTDYPAGGGHDVKVCTKKEDLISASQLFSKSEAVIVEEFVPIKRNFGVLFAKTFDGEIIYLGASEQITNSKGNYLGCWIEKTMNPSEKVIALGREIMENACSMGYRGIAGIDIVETEDNRVLAIDPNFRFTGSTTAILLRDSIFRQMGASTILFHPRATKAPFGKVMAVCKKAIQKGYFVPFYIYKPVTNSIPKLNTRFSGIIAGSSRTYCKRINRSLKRILTHK